MTSHSYLPVEAAKVYVDSRHINKPVSKLVGETAGKPVGKAVSEPVGHACVWFARVSAVRNPVTKTVGKGEKQALSWTCGGAAGVRKSVAGLENQSGTRPFQFLGGRCQTSQEASDRTSHYASGR